MKEIPCSNNAPTGVEMETPDFKRLIDSMREEVLMSKALVLEVMERCSRISSIEQGTPHIEPTKPSTGVIDMLWQQVWEIRNTNEELSRIKAHLQSLVG